MSPGDVIWHELWTPVPVATAQFYRELFGWQLSVAGDDLVLHADGAPAVRVHRATNATDATEPQAGPWGWTIGLEVTDIDAAVARAVSARAVVLPDPPNGPGPGDRGVSLQHPDAGCVQLIRPGGVGTTRTTPFVWHQLDTPDPARAEQVYGRVAGWVVVPTETPGLQAVRGRSLDRIATFTAAPPALGPQWLPYIGVCSVPDIVRLAAKLGGSVIIEHFELPPLRGPNCLLRAPDGLLVACSEVCNGV